MVVVEGKLGKGRMKRMINGGEEAGLSECDPQKQQ